MSENKLPTAREFYDAHDSDDAVVMMRDFARMHVEAALKEAGEKLDSDYCFAYSSERNFYSEHYDSILNSYPLENIK